MTLTNLLEQEKKHQGESPSYEEAQTELEACASSPYYFLKRYAQIKDQDRGIIPFEPWEHLVELLDAFETHREVIILKARQLGVSWLCAGYALWTVLFKEGARVLMLSQGETEAVELLNKVRFIHSYLPDFLRLSKGKDQEQIITFPALHSEVRALPSTEKAGHGYGATLVIRDELERHPYAEENFAAVAPSVDAGGKHIDLSTTRKTQIGTHFKTRYLKAKNGDIGAYPVFLSDYERLSRLTQMGYSKFDEWRAYLFHRYTSLQVEEQYPLTEAEALDTTGTLQFFSRDAIEWHKTNCREPIEYESLAMFPTIKIYEPPVVGARYILYTDSSDGKEDPHASILLKAENLVQVAESHGKVSADICALIHDRLARHYGAFNSFDAVGGAGMVMEKKLRDLDTPNVCPRLDPNLSLSTKGQIGWTWSKKLWDTAIWGLEEAIRTMTITVRNKEILDEFTMFYVPEGKEPEKIRGGHDDYIDAFARVLLLRRYLPVSAGMVRSYPIRRF